MKEDLFLLREKLLSITKNSFESGNVYWRSLQYWGIVRDDELLWCLHHINKSADWDWKVAFDVVTAKVADEVELTSGVHLSMHAWHVI